MANKRKHPAVGFEMTVAREPGLWRIGIAGVAGISDVARIRAARAQTETDTVPVLVVDEGMARIDTVAYGALAQWGLATRNRNVGWATTLALETAGRMLQMGGLPVVETVFPTEESARQALDRGKAGLRVVKPNPVHLALDGLRRE